MLHRNRAIRLASALNSRETLQMAAEAAGVGTWDLAVLENELHSSPRCKEIFGVAADARFQYEDFLTVLHAEDRDMVHAVVQRALDPKGTGTYEVDYRVTHPDGEVRWVGARGKAFFEQRGNELVATRFIGTVLDRTERHKTQEALVAAEKLATTGRLAASIAHEIRNPLDAVSNLLYLLRTERSEEKRSEYLAQAEEELARVSEIATNTLRFYRDPVGVSTFDIAELTQSVLLLFHGRIAALKVLVEAGLPQGILVSASQSELRQVIVNLVGNALDAMPKGGRLILRVREFVDHHANRLCVSLTVADTGSGMTPEVSKRIFDAFYTTKGAAGTGLGLWLSLEIMKKCGSSLKVKSALGQGTVFHISLIGALPDNHRKHGALDLDGGNELRRRTITQRPGAVTAPESTPSETQL